MVTINLNPELFDWVDKLLEFDRAQSQLDKKES